MLQQQIKKHLSIFEHSVSEQCAFICDQKMKDMKLVKKFVPEKEKVPEPVKVVAKSRFQQL